MQVRKVVVAAVVDKENPWGSCSQPKMLRIAEEFLERGGDEREREEGMKFLEGAGCRPAGIPLGMRSRFFAGFRGNSLCSAIPPSSFKYPAVASRKSKS